MLAVSRVEGYDLNIKGCPSNDNELDLIAGLRICLPFPVLRGMTTTKRGVLHMIMN